MLASSSTSETGNARRQHTSPAERDAASDTSHDPRTRSVPTSSAPPSSRDVRATLSPAPTTLASTNRCSANGDHVSAARAARRRRSSAQRSHDAHRHLASPAHGVLIGPAARERAAAATRPSSCVRLPSARLLVSVFGSFLSVGCPNFWGLVGVHTGPPKFAGMAIQTVRQVQGSMKALASSSTFSKAL